MSTSTKWLIRTLRSLTDRAKSVINSFSILIQVLSCDAFGITPSRWIPCLGVFPQVWVNLAYGGACENKVSFGYDVYAIFGWSSKRGGNGHVIADFAKKAVEGWVKPKSLADDSIQKGKSLELFVGWRTKFTIWSGEKFNLFFIQSLADMRRKLRGTERGLLGVRTQLYDCVRDGEESMNQWQNSYVGQPSTALS
jgi:hypothetical protein